MTKFCFSNGGGGYKQTLSRNIIGMAVPSYNINRPALMAIATFLLTTPHLYQKLVKLPDNDSR